MIIIKTVYYFDMFQPTKLNVYKNDAESWDYTTPALGKLLSSLSLSYLFFWFTQSIIHPLAQLLTHSRAVQLWTDRESLCLICRFSTLKPFLFKIFILFNCREYFWSLFYHQYFANAAIATDAILVLVSSQLGLMLYQPLYYFYFQLIASYPPQASSIPRSGILPYCVIPDMHQHSFIAISRLQPIFL